VVGFNANSGRLAQIAKIVAKVAASKPRVSVCDLKTIAKHRLHYFDLHHGLRKGVEFPMPEIQEGSALHDALNLRGVLRKSQRSLRMHEAISDL
jgi:hypothetical protein